MVMAPIDRRCIPLPPKPPVKPQIDPASIDKFTFGLKDKNKDGSLSFDEYIKSTPNATVKDAETFKRYDKDGDGQLTQEEYLAGKAQDRRFGNWIGIGVGHIKEKFEPFADFISAKK